MFEENYYHKVYYGSTLFHDSADYEEYFETEDEAREEAQSYVDDKIEQYKLDGAWNDYDSEDDFDIVIEEV